jgi:hypothetical protein
MLWQFAIVKLFAVHPNIGEVNPNVAEWCNGKVNEQNAWFVVIRVSWPLSCCVPDIYFQRFHKMRTADSPSVAVSSSLFHRIIVTINLQSVIHY